MSFCWEETALVGLVSFVERVYELPCVVWVDVVVYDAVHDHEVAGELVDVIHA